MTIELLSPREWEPMRVAGRTAAGTLAWVGAQLVAGMTGRDIDALVRQDTARRGGTPSQLGFHGFPGAVCVSRNEVVCHGIPTERVVLRPGDIVNIDVTTQIGGYHGDCSMTFAIPGPAGPAQAEAARLIDATRRALAAGIAAVKLGGRLGDVGAAICGLAQAEGYGVVREYGGHGIGRSMHMDPHVSHVARAGAGPRLKPGMAFTIEPMLTLGSPATRLLPDGWTVVTADGRWSAQFEHTILLTEAGIEVLTEAPLSQTPR